MKKATKPKLHITITRMLFLIEVLKDKSIINSTQEFCEVIGMQKQSIRNVKIGKQHFTAKHMTLACDTYNINANWLMGLQEEIFRTTPRKLAKVKDLKSAPQVRQNSSILN